MKEGAPQQEVITEGIYDQGQGGNWFEELETRGGGGADYMLPDEAKEREDLSEISIIGSRDDLKG